MAMNGSKQQQRRRRRVCLFGLSADPPTGTEGHVGIVQKLATELTVDNNSNNNNEEDASSCCFDEIRILPVYRHTFASKRNRLSSYEDRMKMCQLAFDGIPNTIVSNAEYLSWCHAVKDLPDEDEDAKAKAFVGTAHLLDYLHETEPDTTVEFTFCLGADAFLDLMAGKWKQSARVRQLLDDRFVVLDRASAYDEKSSSDDDFLLFHQQVAQVPNARLLPNESLGAVSSSQIRAMTTSIADVSDERLLLPAVKDYILQHGLYGTGGDGEQEEEEEEEEP